MALRILEGILGGAWFVSGRRLLAPLLALIVFAFIQTLPLVNGNFDGTQVGGGRWQTISADPYETWRFTVKLLSLVAAGELLLRYTSSRHRLRALIYVVIGIGVASALFGIVRQAMEAGGTSGFVFPHLSPGPSYGQFDNRNHFALLMEMTLGLVLGLIIWGGVHWCRTLIYIATAVPVWTALVLTTSRGAIFSMFAQMLFLVLLFIYARAARKTTPTGSSPKEKVWGICRSLMGRAALTACLMTTVTVGILWVGGDSLLSRLEAMPKELSAESSDGRAGMRRIEIWHATWQLIKANSVVGVGFGAFGTAIAEYRDASGVWEPQQVHNEYLELLASGGLVGAALAAWFVIALIKLARVRLRSADPFRRAACLGALTGLFAVAAHSMVDFGLHVTANTLVFSSLIVIAVANKRVEETTAGPGCSPPPLSRISYASV